MVVPSRSARSGAGIIRQFTHAGVWVLTGGAMILLMLQVVACRSQVAQLRVEARQASSQIQIGELEHVALVKVLKALKWDESFMPGTIAIADSQATHDQVKDGVYYLIATTCGACPKNYPALERLHEVAPGRINVVALDAGSGDLGDYAVAHGLNMPVWGSVVGRLTSNIPSYATPVTLLFRNGRLVRLVTGPIDERTEAYLAANVRNDGTVGRENRHLDP